MHAFDLTNDHELHHDYILGEIVLGAIKKEEMRLQMRKRGRERTEAGRVPDTFIRYAYIVLH